MLQGALLLATVGGYPSAFGPSGFYDIVSPYVMDRFENRASLTVGAYLGYVEGTFYASSGASEKEDFAFGRVGVCYTPSDWFEVYSLLRGIEWWPGGGSDSYGGFSDADVGVHFRLLKLGFFGLGALASATLPTGETQEVPIVIDGDSLGTYTITDGKTIFGGSVQAQFDFSRLHSLSAFRLVLNAGYWTGGGYYPSGDNPDLHDPLRLGAAFVISSRFIDYIIEAKYFGRTNFEDHAFITPVFRFRPFEGVGFHVLGGINLNTTYYIPEDRYEWNYDVIAGFGLITPVFKTEELKPGGSVLGKVYDAKTKEPIRDAEVKVVEANITIKTDSNGLFRIKHVPEGTYTIVTTKEGYRKAYNLLTVKRRSHNLVEIPMDPAQVLVRGIVIDSVTSEPIGDVKIAFSGVESKEVTATEEGFELKLKPGAYWLSASKEGYFTKYMDVALYEPKFIRIVLGRPIVRKPVLIATVNFATASANLNQKAKAELDRVAKILLEDPAAKIVVTGHTDRHGTVFYNELLSEKRAKAVRDYLIENYDIDPSRIHVEWYTEFQKKGRSDSANRRAEIYLLKPEMPEKAKTEKKEEGKKEEKKEDKKEEGGKK